MDIKIEWSDEPVGYGVVYYSGYRQAIVYLIKTDETDWGWAFGNLAVDGFATKDEAKKDALAHYKDGRANFYEQHYGVKDV